DSERRFVLMRQCFLIQQCTCATFADHAPRTMVGRAHYTISDEENKEREDRAPARSNDENESREINSEFDRVRHDLPLRGLRYYIVFYGAHHEERGTDRHDPHPGIDQPICHRKFEMMEGNIGDDEDGRRWDGQTAE